MPAEVVNQSHYGATYFVKNQACVTAWTEVAFTDANGDNFLAGHIKLMESAGWGVEFSFDPTNGTKDVHGYIEAGQEVQLDFKHAKHIYVRRGEGVDTTVRITAWR